MIGAMELWCVIINHGGLTTPVHFWQHKTCRNRDLDVSGYLKHCRPHIPCKTWNMWTYGRIIRPTNKGGWDPASWTTAAEPLSFTIPENKHRAGGRSAQELEPTQRLSCHRERSVYWYGIASKLQGLTCGDQDFIKLCSSEAVKGIIVGVGTKKRN